MGTLGEMRERSNRAVSKTVEPLAAPWVRIPLSPRALLQGDRHRARAVPRRPWREAGTAPAVRRETLPHALHRTDPRSTGTCPAMLELLVGSGTSLSFADLDPSIPRERGWGLGEMTEWPKVHAWKACVLVRVPWVRIPLSPYNPSGVDVQAIRYGLLPNPVRPGREQRQAACS